jgi:hypothetical protein
MTSPPSVLIDSPAIHRLCPDILLTIFSYIIPRIIRIRPWRTAGPAGPMMDLSLVCQRWAQLVFDGQFWTHILIDFRDWNDYDRLNELAALVFTRSGTRRLSITLRGELTADHFVALSPHLSRLWRLSLDWPEDSQLDWLLDIGTVALQHLKIVDIHFPNELLHFDPANVRFPWEQLTSLCLHDCLFDIAHRILRRCPGLIKLIIDLCQPRQTSDHNPPLYNINLPELTTLQVNTDHCDFYQKFFDSIAAPRLSEVDILDVSHTKPFDHSFLTSGLPIKGLNLEFPVTVEQIHAFLEIPTLTDLTIVLAEMGTLPSDFVDTLREWDTCRNLVTMKLFTMDEAELMSTLWFRSIEGQEFPLKKIIIAFWTTEEDALLELNTEDLQASGWMIEHTQIRNY